MSNLREDIALRLTEERGRLGYSKANLAHIAEISNEQLRLYELGRTGMPVEFLARIFELGFDIQYVTVGVRKEGMQTRIALAVSETKLKVMCKTAYWQATGQP